MSERYDSLSQAYAKAMVEDLVGAAAKMACVGCGVEPAGIAHACANYTIGREIARRLGATGGFILVAPCCEACDRLARHDSAYAEKLQTRAEDKLQKAARLIQGVPSV